MQPFTSNEFCETLSTVITPGKLNEAWHKVLSKGKGGGIDNVSIEDFKCNAPNRISELYQSVSSNRYVPEPYKVFYIEKRNGDFRPLGLLTLDDKILQNCICTL